MNQEMKIAIRVDGNQTLGFGNFSRCRLLAHRLKEAGHQVFFISKAYPDFYEQILKEEIPTFLLSPSLLNGSLNACIGEIITSHNIHILINDIKNTESQYMEYLKKNHTVTVINFDDLGQGRLLADALFDGFQFKLPTDTGKNHFYGKDYIILRPEFSVPSGKAIEPIAKKMAILLGGTNTDNSLSVLTHTLFELTEIVDIEFEFIIPPSIRNALDFQLDFNSPAFHFHYDPPNIAHILKQADIAITGGGLSMCESMSLGTPTIVLPKVPHEYENAAYFHSMGAAILLDPKSPDFKHRLVMTLNDLIFNTTRRTSLSNTGKSAIDGQGLNRILQFLSAPAAS